MYISVHVDIGAFVVVTLHSSACVKRSCNLHYLALARTMHEEGGEERKVSKHVIHCYLLLLLPRGGGGEEGKSSIVIIVTSVYKICLLLIRLHISSLYIFITIIYHYNYVVSFFSFLFSSLLLFLEHASTQARNRLSSHVGIPSRFRPAVRTCAPKARRGEIEIEEIGRSIDNDNVLLLCSSFILATRCISVCISLFSLQQEFVFVFLFFFFFALGYRL